MPQSSGGPFEAGINLFLLIVMVLILYSVYTATQGGNPSGIIQLFADLAPTVFIGLLVVSGTLWILSQAT